MRQLGELDPRKLEEKDVCRTTFPPLPLNIYRDLLESIRKAGILTPLIVMRRNDTYVILAGHHRRKAALELGIDKVPCNLAETDEEIEDSVFDNLYRRQMTEAERANVMSRKHEIVDSLIRETAAPELYELFRRGKIDRKLLNTLAALTIAAQKECLTLLATKASSGAALRKQEKKLRAEFAESLQQTEQQAKEAAADGFAKEKEDLERKLAEMTTELGKKTQEVADIEEKKKQILQLKELYTAKKEELERQLKEELEPTGEEAGQIRSDQGQAIMDKNKEIGELNDKLESLKTKIKGKESEIGLLRISVGIALERYALQAKAYETPDVLLGPLKMLHDFLARALEAAKGQRLLPDSAARVKELVMRIKTAAEKIDVVCQANVINLPVLDDELKAMDDSVKAALAVEGKDGASPALSLVRDNTQ